MRRLALGIALVACCPPIRLSAQSLAAGTVLLARGADSTPVPRIRVLLHRVGRAAQGPVDSVLTDAAGRFRFRFAADTGSVYLVSAPYGGVEYFSPPVHLDPARPDTALRVVVADTSSTQPIGLAARHLVITAPRQDASRAVLDLIVLDNAGPRTRIAPDPLRPSWTGPLPRGSLGLEVGEGDYSTDAVQRRGDRVAFLAPIPPGDKQIVVDYALPADLRDLVLPMEQSAPTVNLLVEERGARVLTPGLAPADSELIQGKSYRRWTGALAAGTVVRVRLPGAASIPRWLLPAMVAAAAAALALGGFRAARRPGARAEPAPPPGATAPSALVDAIAALDARYAGREAETEPPEWARYLQERARLKAELEATLAAGRDAP
ncbi:MAG TPA: hypothetical protein VFK09_09775 [Gemmatimonadales bacterium]|nr:hypothetical protein [Gemmatimonadales bacterium]